MHILAEFLVAVFKTLVFTGLTRLSAARWSSAPLASGQERRSRMADGQMSPLPASCSQQAK